MTSQQPLHAVWADRLFERFVVMYGASAVESMWPLRTLPEVKAAWAQALSRHSVETLRRVMQALETRNTRFPPTLPEFLHLCREFNRPEQCEYKELVAPGQARTDPETARKIIAEIRKLAASKTVP